MRTPLYDHHRALGAEMISFAGFDLPLHYGDPLSEWEACRTRAALFDVSHMGVVEVAGAGAGQFLEGLSVRSWKDARPGSVSYTLFGHPSGGTQDDLLIYFFSPDKIWLIVNASRRGSDLDYLASFGKGRFTIAPLDEMAILALQGPMTPKLFPDVEKMGRMHFLEQEGVLISRSGYTGEEGIECIGKKEAILPLFEKWQSQGAKPAGLNARDLLRLEMGYALFGHELSEEISPIGSVAAWTVEKAKSFPGSAHPFLEQFAYGVMLQEKSIIAREGTALYLDQKKIGYATSGGFSPFLKKPIALVLSKQPLTIGQEIALEVRGRKGAGVVVKPPFFSQKDKKLWLENIANLTNGSK